MLNAARTFLLVWFIASALAGNSLLAQWWLGMDRIASAAVGLIITVALLLFIFMVWFDELTRP